jgi:hypothetical protein
MDGPGDSIFKIKNQYMVKKHKRSLGKAHSPGLVPVSCHIFFSSLNLHAGHLGDDLLLRHAAELVCLGAAPDPAQTARLGRRDHALL